MLIIQARAIQAPVRADIVVATHGGAIRDQDLPPLQRELINQLRADGMTAKYVDGSYETAGYELGILLQSSSVNHAENKEIISLWLSPALRTKFKHGEDDRLTESQFQAVGIPTELTSLYEYTDAIQSFGASVEKQHGEASFPADLDHLIAEYNGNRDVVRLWNLAEVWNHWQFARIIDQDSSQQFLVAFNANRTILRAYNLSGTVQFDRGPTRISHLDRRSVRDFAESRKWCLEWRRQP